MFPWIGRIHSYCGSKMTRWKAWTKKEKSGKWGIFEGVTSVPAAVFVKDNFCSVSHILVPSFCATVAEWVCCWKICRTSSCSWSRAQEQLLEMNTHTFGHKGALLPWDCWSSVMCLKLSLGDRWWPPGASLIPRLTSGWPLWCWMFSRETHSIRYLPVRFLGRPEGFRWAVLGGTRLKVEEGVCREGARA